MRRILSREEIVATVALSGSKRYEYWIRQVVAQQQVWSLWQDGWSLAGDDSGNELVPVWPHSVYAEFCATAEWGKYIPKVIDWVSWLEKWLPGIEKDNRRIAVFPIPNNRGVVVEAKRLKFDLEKELLRSNERGKGIRKVE
jgi:hypothetical protein